jgi:DNA-binding transcriptional MerR regulator
MYRVHEFAELAGVTVKALQHYDRLGLLKPARTDSGHRVYVTRDLERLEQIMALKFLGLSLKQIRQVLERDAVPLAEALRLQRQVLEDQRRRLDRAIKAIADVEADIEDGLPSNSAILKQLIEVIGMPDDIDVMKKYYSDEAWNRWRFHYEHDPSPEVRDMLREGRELLGTDPGSDRAQALLKRWGVYWLTKTHRDPEIMEGMMRAWHDRDNWPAALRERVLSAETEPIMHFLGEVAWERMATSCEHGSSRFSVPHRGRESRIAFFREVSRALDEAPTSETARELAQRWDALVESEAAGDPETKARLLASWRSRSQWPPMMRTWIAGLCMMSEQRWLAACSFLERAAADQSVNA